MSVHLPIYEGMDHPSFLDLQDTEDALLASVERESLTELERHTMLGTNSKTTVALNVAVGQSCRPTRICASVCYAVKAESPLTWIYPLLKALRNYRYIKIAPTLGVVARLIREFEAARRKAYRDGKNLDFLRFLGMGDLFEELVEVINEFARLNSNVLLWVPTRKFDLAKLVKPYPNMRVLLSLDASTSEGDLTVARKLANQPHISTTFLRTSASENTVGAAIVYPAKPSLAANPRLDCPVDAGRLDRGPRGKQGYPCLKCRRCLQPHEHDSNKGVVAGGRSE